MATEPPPSTLEVASAFFFHRDCDDHPLFQSEYQRCFPHCCPTHVRRSYCGTSLSVLVQLAKRVQKGPQNSEPLMVFARFDAESDVSLRVGECVDMESIEDDTQTETNSEGQWVKGKLERPASSTIATRTSDTPPEDQKLFVFHLNAKPHPHWYYQWESNANKTQRSTKHAFRGYVFERCAVDLDDKETTCPKHAQVYRVIHVVTSPTFTISSFRGASSVDSSAVAQQALQDSNVSTSRTDESPRKVEPVRIVQTNSTAHYAPRGDDRSGPSFVDSELTKQQQTTTEFVRDPESQTADDVLQDTLRWEQANLASVTVSKNLALLYSFLRWTPLSHYAPIIDELVGLLAMSTGESNIPLSLMNGYWTALPNQLKILLQVLSQATLWLFSREARQWIRSFFQQNATSVLDKKSMRDCFLLFLHELEDRMNTQVFTTTSLCSLANVAEEVIAAVYSNEYFYPRRRRVREILSGQRFSGWNAFVSQMREVYISLTVHPGVPQVLIGRPGLTFHQVHPPRNSVESDWNAKWILDVDEAVWEPTQQTMKAVDVDPLGIGDVRPVSLFMLFDIISQIICLDVAIDVQASTLFIRSTQGVAGPLDSTHLILDGKSRVFSQFPNGMPTSTDVGSRGDYIGEMHVKRPDQVTVHLQIFNWAVQEEDGPSYHVRMRIECWRGLQLCVSGDVLTTTAPSSFTAEEVSLLGEMSLREKRAAVSNTHDQWLRLNVTGGGVTATMAAMAPWKQLGRFHLSYNKL